MPGIYFSYTGKREHRQHWAECSETQAELRQTAIDLCIDIRERFPKAAVWVENRRVQVTEKDKEAYYARVKEILAKEPATGLDAQVDAVLDDWEGKPRKKVMCRKGGKKRWHLSKALLASHSKGVEA